MPGLTPEEKEELFQQAKAFADTCRERQSQLPQEYQLIHYATDEEIRQNLENPEFVNNYLKAKTIKEEYEKKSRLSEEESEKHNKNGLSVGSMSRSKATMHRVPDSEENKKYNEKLEEILYDPDKGKLNYEKYLKDALDDDYSDLEGALASRSKGLDFYQKHAPKLTGFFSGENLLQGLGLNETTEKHFQNLRTFFTNTWSFFEQMRFTASFANFAVTEIPPRDFMQYGNYMSLMFPKTDHPYRMYFEGIHSINDLHLMKDQVKRYKALGGDLGPGFLRDFEVVDKTGKPVSIDSKPIEELRLQKLSNEKSKDLSNLYTPEVYESHVKIAVRVARDPQKTDSLDEHFLPPYKRDETLIEQKRNQLAESVRSYNQMNRFFRIFAFGQRKVISNNMKEMKAVGATDLEVKLTRNGGTLTQKQYRKFLSNLQKSSLGDDVRNPKPTCAADKEFAVDIRCLKNATVKDVDAEQIGREVGLIEQSVPAINPSNPEISDIPEKIEVELKEQEGSEISIGNQEPTNGKIKTETKEYMEKE